MSDFKGIWQWYKPVAHSTLNTGKSWERPSGRPTSVAVKTVFYLFAFSLATYALLTSLNPFRHLTSKHNHHADPDFSYPSAHCAHIPPISSESFLARQQSLAETLHSLNAAAYIAEPSANGAYFANLSSSHWHLSERPLLLVITPQVDTEGTVHANVSILTPSFEATRAKLLPIPSASDITYPEWPEDVDPYEVAVSVIPGLENSAIYVDSSIRHFIVDGLQSAAPKTKVESAPVEIRRLRERKSGEELDILKCANEVTLLSIRAAREYMYIGMRESEAGGLVTKALTAAGLRDAFALTLFGENAALPHGSGTDRILTEKDFILVDCGGRLHGYESDVTRTFALQWTLIPLQHLAIWELVYSAQSAALDAARNGTITAEVDRVAREVIGADGYASYFTHRLGHGIGLEGHESPYLRGGSEDIILTGHTFSDEPGIYIEGEVGVRLEDCFYIDDKGRAVYLTEGVGGQASSPWDI